jgi:hypothetical protein
MKERKRQKLSEEEVDQLVIAEANDPDAWEEPIFVPSSRSPRPEWMNRSKHLDLAAKFYVLSVLHRLGAEANLTLAQPDDVDITVVQEPGHAITIDVKTLAGTKEWLIDRFRAEKHHYVVFVCYLEPVQDPAAIPEVYILPSERLKFLVARTKKTRVPVDSFKEEPDSHESWQQLTSAAA